MTQHAALALLRSAFYALTVSLGLLVASLELTAGNITVFWQIGIAVLFVFIVELYSSLNIVKHKQVKSPTLAFDDFTRAGQLINHLIIPGVLYLSLLTFTYVNQQPQTIGLILLVNFIVCTFLFTHMRAYFQQDIALLLLTQQAYDLAKLLSVFCLTNVFLNLSLVQGWGIAGVIVILLGFGALLALTLKRYQRITRPTVLVATILLVLGLLLLVSLMSWAALSIMQMTFIFLVYYYIATAALQHYLEQELRLELVLEYVLVLITLIAVLLGLSA